MSTIADDLRARVAALRKEAIELEALAARIDGQHESQKAFIGDFRAHAVASAICAALDVSLAEVLSDDRRAQVVIARDFCAHAFRNLLGFALQRVATTLGKLDHQTAAYALRRVRDRRQVDKRYAADLARAMTAAHAALAKLEGIEPKAPAEQRIYA